MPPPDAFLEGSAAGLLKTIASAGTKAIGAVAPSRVIEPMVQLFAYGKRTPVYRRPDEVGLQYEDVFFPSMDGVALEGWFIPADSDRLLICNHFLPGNRYGYAGHLDGLQDFGGFEVNFQPEYRALGTTSCTTTSGTTARARAATAESSASACSSTGT
jgi:hypothetical protein